MRTTLNIDNEALVTIRKNAEERGITLGQSASDLVHRGAKKTPKFKMKNGWVVFDLPPDAPPITNEMVDRLENADHDAAHQRAFEEQVKHA